MVFLNVLAVIRAQSPLRNVKSAINFICPRGMVKDAVRDFWLMPVLEQLD